MLQQIYFCFVTLIVFIPWLEVRLRLWAMKLIPMPSEYSSQGRFQVVRTTQPTMHLDLCLPQNAFPIYVQAILEFIGGIGNYFMDYLCFVWYCLTLIFKVILLTFVKHIRYLVKVFMEKFSVNLYLLTRKGSWLKKIQEGKLFLCNSKELWLRWNEKKN